MYNLGGNGITGEENKLSRKDIKEVLGELLKSGDKGIISAAIKKYRPRQAVNALFPFIYNSAPVVKWGAITAMGEAVGFMAEEDLESARNVIRRLMWNLNDESGGIGWGSPEAMAEILAGNDSLAIEYHKILLSYANENGNFQENEIIQRGVLWGIGRIAEKYPDLVKKSAVDVIKFLDSDDPLVRAYAVRIVGILRLREVRSKLDSILNDDSEIQIFIDRELINCRVKDMVNEAMNNLDTK